MRAAVYHGAGRVSLDDVPEPQLPLGGLLIDVSVCGICGSDLMNWYQDTKAPSVLGHEPVGVVMDGEVGEIRPGQRVYVHHHVPCMDCELCRSGRHTLCPNFRRSRIDPGGLAERVAVPDEIARLDVLPVPDGLSDAAASIIEPLACVLRGQRMAGVGSGSRIAVVGCGSMGLLEMGAAAAAGAEAVVGVEPRAERRRVAQQSGYPALPSPDPDRVAGALGGLADAVFVCTSNPRAIASALELAGPGGVVQLFAPPAPGTPVALDLGAVWFREVSIQSTYSAGPEDTRAALGLLSRGGIDGEALISHRLSLTEVEEAFRLARSGEALKVLVEID